MMPDSDLEQLLLERARRRGGKTGETVHPSDAELFGGGGASPSPSPSPRQAVEGSAMNSAALDEILGPLVERDLYEPVSESQGDQPGAVVEQQWTGERSYVPYSGSQAGEMVALGEGADLASAKDFVQPVERPTQLDVQVGTPRIHDAPPMEVEGLTLQLGDEPMPQSMPPSGPAGGGGRRAQMPRTFPPSGPRRR